MSFFMFKHIQPPAEFFEDSEGFKKVPQANLNEIIQRTFDKYVRSIPTNEEDIAKKTTLDPKIVRLGLKFVYNVFCIAATVSEQEIQNDFEQLKLPESHGKAIFDWLHQERDQFDEWWKRQRNEAVPRLCDFNWRIDRRSFSSDYLKGEEVVALVRLQAQDGEEYSKIYFELDKEKLSYLESSLNELKQKFLETEKAVGNKKG